MLYFVSVWARLTGHYFFTVWIRGRVESCQCRTIRSTTNPTALASRRLDWRRRGDRTIESALSRSDWVCSDVRQK